MNVIIRPNGRTARLDWGAGPRPAAIGRGGIGIKAREGDGVTPLGSFPVRRLLWRADRLAAPRTRLAMAPILADDGWCDAPADPAYNTQVKLPHPASHEALLRADGIYDVVVVLGFNDDPVVAGRGSAIFLHVAREDHGPTEGCIALALTDLLELVERLGPGDILTVTL